MKIWPKIAAGLNALGTYSSDMGGFRARLQWEYGFLVGERGEPAVLNPHKYNTPLWRAWDHGHHCGKLIAQKKHKLEAHAPVCGYDDTHDRDALLRHLLERHSTPAIQKMTQLNMHGVAEHDSRREYALDAEDLQRAGEIGMETLYGLRLVLKEGGE